MGPCPRRGLARSARAASSRLTSSSSSRSSVSTLSSRCSTSSSLTSSRELPSSSAVSSLAHEPPPPPAPTGSWPRCLGTRAEPGRDAEGAGALEPRALAEQDHERPRVEPGDRHVHDRGEAEEEGKALHVADRHEIEDDGGEQRNEVGRPHRAPCALEAAVDGRADRAARSGLVFQTFEIDDVRVDGDPDRDDETGDAGQVEARGHRRVPERRDDGPQHHGGEHEARDHHEAQAPGSTSST